MRLALLLFACALGACSSSSDQPAVPADASASDSPGIDAAPDGSLDAGEEQAEPDSGVQVVLTVGSQSLGPVNRRLLGNNLEWVNRADGLVDGQGAWLPDRLQTARDTGMPLLRYPGGTLSDAFHFADSILPLASRPKGIDLAGQQQSMELGAAEFLEACMQLGAEPLLTLNMLSGTTQDAVDWLKYARDEGATRGWPEVAYWEIGNEPYLTTTAPGYGTDDLTPETYASRANAVMKALRAENPNVRLAIPLRADTMNGLETATKKGYEDKVLSLVTEPYELVAVHDGYLPVDMSNKASKEELYLATMAGPLAFEEALAQHRSKLDAAKPGNTIKFALTEYHPWLTLETLIVLQTPGYTTQQLLDAVKKDHCANSMAGVIYTADLLRAMAYRNDVELATFWSAAGNYVFGAINDNGHLRGPALALQAVGNALKGDLLPVTGEVPKLSTPAVGYVHAFDAVPAVTALAASDANGLHMLLINKHPTASIRVQVAGVSLAQYSVMVLTADDALAYDDTAPSLHWKPLASATSIFDLPPHSLVTVSKGE